MATTSLASPRLLSISEVVYSLGISKPTLYRGIKSGNLPAPVKISARRVGWRSSDIAKVVAGDWEDGVNRG